MTKQQLIERNRSNAQSSTGPTSQCGKKTVSQNARRLGLFVSDGTLELEDPQELAELIAGYTADYVPKGCIETELVRQLSMATHRLRRLERIESAAMFTDQVAHTRFEASVIIEERFTNICDKTERIQRARSHAERTFNRTYKELEARKDSRATPRAQPEELEIEEDTKHEALPESLPKKQFVHVRAAGASPWTSPSPLEILQNKPSSLAANQLEEAGQDAEIPREEAA